MLYGKNGAIFIPLDTLVNRYNNIAPGHTPAEINVELSSLFWRDRAQYTVDGFF